jgi:hypothetical protein
MGARLVYQALHHLPVTPNAQANTFTITFNPDL